jgi:Hemerythrin HHE cation binding domain
MRQAKEDAMNFRTLMQAGPAKANELFARLAETSDGAVKTREKLFTELKNELELHTSLEEQHLFPILRRNAETKELVADAIKDNKELRAKLAELEALPKSDEAFPERLKELQKTFRQHARDEKRELLPAVQRALSEEQVLGVAEKIEAGIAEADQARQGELEERRVKARQEREQGERQAEHQAEAERVQKAAVEQARHDEAAQKRVAARHEREEAERQAEQEAVGQSAQEEAERRVGDAAEVVASAESNVLHIGKSAAANAERVGAEMNRVADAYVGAATTMAPGLPSVASEPKIAVDAMTEIQSAWIDWMRQTAVIGTRMSQELLRQAAEQQQRFAADAVEGWMEHNTHVLQIIARVAAAGLRPFANRSAGSDERGSGR